MLDKLTLSIDEMTSPPAEYNIELYRLSDDSNNNNNNNNVENNNNNNKDVYQHKYSQVLKSRLFSHINHEIFPPIRKVTIAVIQLDITQSNAWSIINYISHHALKQTGHDEARNYLLNPIRSE
eukprot:UN05053